MVSANGYLSLLITYFICVLSKKNIEKKSRSSGNFHVIRNFTQLHSLHNFTQKNMDSIKDYLKAQLRGEYVEHTASTPEERSILGTSLLEVSADWKRVLSPMLGYKLVQEALILLMRQSQECVQHSNCSHLCSMAPLLGSFFKLMLCSCQLVPHQTFFLLLSVAKCENSMPC